MTIEGNRLVVTTKRIDDTREKVPRVIYLTGNEAGEPKVDYSTSPPTQYFPQEDIDGMVFGVEDLSANTCALSVRLEFPSPSGGTQYNYVQYLLKGTAVYKEIINPGTGKPYDPLASFYSPLAN